MDIEAQALPAQSSKSLSSSSSPSQSDILSSSLPPSTPTKSPLLGNTNGSFTLTTETKTPSLCNTSGSFTLITKVTEKENYEANIPRSNYYPSLLKVPHQLRQINNNAYEPLLISIGPYHRGKPHLKEMEFYKRSLIISILGEKGEKVDDQRVNDSFDQARNCYSPDVYKLKDQEFSDMMRVDGCFIIALIKHISCISCGMATVSDPIFKLQWVLGALCQDLLLLENQLPFFVLVALYNAINKEVAEDGEDFASQAFSVLVHIIPEPKQWNKTRNPTIKDTRNIKHLLSLVHDNWSPSSKGKKEHESTKEGSQGKCRFTLCAVEMPKEKKLQVDEEGGSTKSATHNYLNCKFLCCTREENLKGRVERKSISCATELQEAGIEFLNCTQGRNVGSLFDVSFTNYATMEIPTFVIDDTIERLFRNLIAFEMYQEGSTYVIDYVTLMDNLINSAADVKLLRLSGIIENMLGSDEAVAQMINKLLDNVTLGETFYYEEMFVNVKLHCSRRWNTWKAKLRHDYFYSPWALVSFLAALLVILVTIAQFVIALLPLV